MKAPRTSPSIPAFGLYGERPLDPEPNYFHVERVRDRASLHAGDVRPHRHAHLHQLSYWFGGGGDYMVDGAARRIAPSTVTVMPAGAVHGFRIDAKADAIVLSLAGDFAAATFDAREPALAELLRTPAMVPLVPPADSQARRLFRAMEVEHARGRPGRETAIVALCTLVLLLVLRQDGGVLPDPGRRTALFDRFGELLELHFRERWSVGRYAAALGASPYLLNAAAGEGAGDTAAGLIQRRRMLEARRLLVYTALGVGEVAFTLGFDDASHFSRAFRRAVGTTPQAWRQAAVDRIPLA